MRATAGTQLTCNDDLLQQTIVAALVLASAAFTNAALEVEADRDANRSARWLRAYRFAGWELNLRLRAIHRTPSGCGLL